MTLTNRASEPRGRTGGGILASEYVRSPGTELPDQ
jgi:hypothetical protein